MDENTPHKDSDITIGNWDEAFGILSTRKEAISDRYTPPAKKCQELAHHATTAIAALMNDGSDGVDYRAVLALSLPDAVYERSVTVVVDGSAAWPLIATLRNAGRTPEQIIVDLQSVGVRPPRRGGLDTRRGRGNLSSLAISATPNHAPRPMGPTERPARPVHRSQRGGR